MKTKLSTAVWFFRTLGILAVGALVGAGVALMLTPKSGRGLREDLRERLRRAPEEIKQVVASITARVSEQAGPSA
jgi:gas vesicle protein